MVFVTLEDETGIANPIVWREVFERYRGIIRLAKGLRASGKVERHGEVVHLHVQGVEPLGGLHRELASASRDFH